MMYYYVVTLHFRVGERRPELPADETIVAVLDKDLVPERKYVTVLVATPRETR